MEAEYARGLRRLVARYSPGPSSQDQDTSAETEMVTRVLEEVSNIYISTHHPYIYTFCIQVGYIAGQHEVVADCINTELCKVDTHRIYLDIQRMGGFLTRRIV